IAARELPQHRRHVGVCLLVEVRECGLSRPRERQVGPSSIRVRAGPANDAALVETADHTAQVPGVETELSTDVGGRRLFGMRDLVEHPRFGERELTAEPALLQDADLLRVEAIEAADGLDAGGGVHCGPLSSN